MAWRYFATRLNGDGTETHIANDIQLDGVSITTTLSGVSSIQGSIPMNSRFVVGDAPVFEEWSTAIYAVEEGVIRGAGIIVDASPNGHQLDIDAVGWVGYISEMPYTGPGYLGVKVDPLDVAREVWKHVQSQRGGNIGLSVDPLKSGKTIGTELKQVEFDTQSGPISFEAGPIKMNWHSTHDLLEFFDQLAEETPFDYIERHAFDANGAIKHTLDFGHPRIGRRRTDVRLVWGVNIMPDLAFKSNGEDYASAALVLGRGEGAAMAHTIYEPITRPNNRLRRVVVVRDDTLGSKKSLEHRAKAELAWRKILSDIDTVKVIDHNFAPLGSIELGDEVHLMGRGDWGPFDMWARVTSITISPDDPEVVTYKVMRTDKIEEG